MLAELMNWCWMHQGHDVEASLYMIYWMRKLCSLLQMTKCWGVHLPCAFLQESKQVGAKTLPHSQSYSEESLIRITCERITGKCTIAFDISKSEEQFR
jgi:hypothetical protein